MGKPIDFSAGFSAAVAANAKVWEHDRSQTVGASEVAGCWRHSYFKKREPELAETPEEVDPEWGHTERGNLIENEFVVPTLKHMFGEDRCLFMGSNQKTFVDGRLSATPDGVVTDLPNNALELYGVADIATGVIATEVKSFGGEHAAPRRKKLDDGQMRYTAKTKHIAQNIVQMGILQRKTNYQPQYGVVLYVNPVNLKDIRPAAVQYDDNVYKHLKDRAEAVFDPQKSAKDFPAEGLLTGDCTYCDFCNACNKVEMERFPDKVIKTETLDTEKQEKLYNLTAKVQAYRDEMKRIETEKKKAETELKDTMFAIGTTRAAGEGWSASVSQNAGRKSLDKAKLVEELGIDLEDFQTEGNPYFVLRTKVKDEG